MTRQGRPEPIVLYKLEGGRPVPATLRDITQALMFEYDSRAAIRGGSSEEEAGRENPGRVSEIGGGSSEGGRVFVCWGCVFEDNGLRPCERYGYKHTFERGCAHAG